MKKKLFIIGAGIFGCTIYNKLKNKFDCKILEQSNDILSGASTNNLNRVHYGYHYPRDDLTSRQSYQGMKTFIRHYKKAIIKNFDNYYMIAENGKINFSQYLNFLKRNKLNYQIIEKKKFKLKVRNIEGIIKVKEPIYDWQLLKKQIINDLKNGVNLNTKVKKIIKKKNKFQIFTNKKTYYSDYVVDSTYWSTNKIFKKKNKMKYQITSIYDVVLEKEKKLGLTIMDGNFLSFLPKGKSNFNHLYYDVIYSVLENNIGYDFDFDFNKKKKYERKALKNIEKIKMKLKNYLPNIKIKFKKIVYISPRVFMNNTEKNDRRLSKCIQLEKNYFQIISGKVDHAVDIANKLKLKLTKKII